MKTTLSTLVLLLLLGFGASGQSVTFSDTSYFASCYGGLITPFSLPQLQDYWISPPDSTLPALVQGRYTEDTLYFLASPYFPLVADSIGIDSLYLPAGLCWRTSLPAEKFGYNDSVVIIVSGTPTGPAGQYYTGLKVHLTSSSLNLHLYVDRYSSFRYSFRVACRPDSAAPWRAPVDIFRPDTIYCAGGFPVISVSGPTALCPGNTVVLSAPTGLGFGYHWSDGSSTRSITVASAGSYTVTVSSGLLTVASQPVIVTALASCPPGYWNQLYFNSCNTGINAITPIAAAAAGLLPSDTDLPCAKVGQYISDTLYFKTISNLLGTIPVTGLRLDSIYLPAGLCWNSNKINNTFDSSENGIILIQGVTTAPPGQYKLRIIASLWQGTNLLPYMDAESFAGLRYRLKVGCAGSICPPLNTTNITDAVIPDSSTCLGTVADITGPPSICAVQATALLSAPGPGYTYHWSTGEVTQSISVTAAGSYMVTVYAYGDSAVSHPYILTTGPVAHFTLTADPATPHTWIIQNLCSGTGLSYIWAWGDGTADSTAYPSHSYSAPGTYPICVTAQDQAGCTATYCDSSQYLNKTAETITIHVQQYALGVAEAEDLQVVTTYYADAVHFSPAVATPSQVTIYDITGQRIYQQSGYTGTTMTTSHQLSGGVYLVSLSDGVRTRSGRFAVIR